MKCRTHNTCCDHIVIWHTHTHGLLITRLQLFVIRNIHHAGRSFERSWGLGSNKESGNNGQQQERAENNKILPRGREIHLSAARARVVCAFECFLVPLFTSITTAVGIGACGEQRIGVPLRPITFRPQLRGDSQSIFMASTFVLTYIISSISHYCDCWLSDQLPPRAADRLTRSYLIHFLKLPAKL